MGVRLLQINWYGNVDQWISQLLAVELARRLAWPWPGVLITVEGEVGKPLSAAEDPDRRFGGPCWNFIGVLTRSSDVTEWDRAIVISRWNGFEVTLEILLIKCFFVTDSSNINVLFLRIPIFGVLLLAERRSVLRCLWPGSSDDILLPLSYGLHFLGYLLP